MHTCKQVVHETRHDLLEYRQACKVYRRKGEHTSYSSIALVPTVETASVPVFISQGHAAGIYCLLHGPITYTIGFHTEGGTGA